VLVFLNALIVAAAVIVIGRAVLDELKAARTDAERGRAVQLLQLFAPAVAQAASDPRALLVWQPLAATARQLAPRDFDLLDRAAGRRFPFTAGEIQAAHSQWTAEWLAWEQRHDAEFKAKSAAAEHDLAASGGSPVMRARLEAIEREKLETYQRRYAEYIRVAKALQALT
jgi:hypothetical protein